MSPPCGTASTRRAATASPDDTEPTGTWRRPGSIAVTLLASAVALGEAIDGTPTIAEQRTLTSAAAVAVFFMWLGADAPRSTRRPPVVVATALLLGATAIAIGRLARLLDHIALRRDEPVTTWSLAIQLTLAVAALAGVARCTTGARRTERATPRTRPTATGASRR